jgi:hypothetical protein
MESFVLQDWVTIRGASGVTVTQGESSWLDLSPYEDIVFWLLVAEVTGTPTLALLYQTSPTKDESFFAAQTLGMTGSSVALSASTNPVITPAFAWSSAFPLARYVRWQIPPITAAWDVTLRVMVSVSSPRT